MELELINNIEKLDTQKEGFFKIIKDVLNKGTEYVLKSLPIQENVKDVLEDVHKCLKNNEYNKLLKTVVNSTIREGAEFLGISENNINKFSKMKEVALKGGLRERIGDSIDIATNQYTKNNLLSDNIDKYIESLKRYVNSKDFDVKLDRKIIKIENKQDILNKIFENWNNSYDKFDINKINENFKELSKNKKVFNNEMDRRYKVIRNITEFVNNTNSKLNNIQMEVCRSI